MCSTTAQCLLDEPVLALRRLLTDHAVAARVQASDKRDLSGGSVDGCGVDDGVENTPGDMLGKVTPSLGRAPESKGCSVPETTPLGGEDEL